MFTRTKLNTYSAQMEKYENVLEFAKPILVRPYRPLENCVAKPEMIDATYIRVQYSLQNVRVICPSVNTLTTSHIVH